MNLAQTFPTTVPVVYPPGTPTWAIGLAVVIGALGTVVAGLVILMPMLRDLIKDIRARQNQQSQRMSTIESDQKTLAMNMPSPAQQVHSSGETLVPQQRAKVPPPSGEHSL